MTVMSRKPRADHITRLVRNILLSRVLKAWRRWSGPSRNGDLLRAGRSGDRIPLGARFSVPVQIGTGVHSASYTMGTGVFPAVKRPGRGVDHAPPCSAMVKERVELYFYSPSGLSWPVLACTLLYFCRRWMVALCGRGIRFGMLINWG